MVEIVNAVGSGELDKEVDLEEFANEVEEANYDPDGYHGVFIRQSENSSLVILYRTGAFIIRGGNSEESLHSARDMFLNRCTNLRIIDSPQDALFGVKNLVCTDDLGRSLELQEVLLTLGFESTEYEPEQFPGLIYRPTQHKCTMLLFASGKIVITGERNLNRIESAIDTLRQKLDLSYI